MHVVWCRELRTAELWWLHHAALGMTGAELLNDACLVGKQWRGAYHVSSAHRDLYVLYHPTARRKLCLGHLG